MIACAVACTAHMTNYLALPDGLSGGNADGGAMGIEGFKAVSVVDFDIVSVPAAPRVGAVG